MRERERRNEKESYRESLKKKNLKKRSTEWTSVVVGLNCRLDEYRQYFGTGYLVIIWHERSDAQDTHRQWIVRVMVWEPAKALDASAPEASERLNWLSDSRVRSPRRPAAVGYSYCVYYIRTPHTHRLIAIRLLPPFGSSIYFSGAKLVYIQLKFDGKCFMYFWNGEGGKIFMRRFLLEWNWRFLSFC